MEQEQERDARVLLERHAQNAPRPPDWNTRLARRVGRRRRRVRSLVGTGAGGVLVLVALFAVQISSKGGGNVDRVTTQPSGDKPAVPSSIRVNGTAVPYAGSVPWADAVAAGPNPRTITIYADGDRTDGGNLCGLPVERVSVVEGAQSVTVSVLGYGAPLPAGESCAGTGHLPQPLQITLRAPLGSRALIDAFDATHHPVLDASTIPKPTSIPAGLVTQPVQWDEKEDFVTHAYTQRSRNGIGRSVVLEYGVFSTCQCAVTHSAPNGQLIETVPVGAVSAQVWHYVDINNDTTAVQWTPAGKKTIRLTTAGTPARHLSIADAIQLARSVR